MFHQIHHALTHPIETSYRFWERFNPEGLLDRYEHLSRKQGIDRLYFALSFDCDTKEDIDVVEKVHERLSSMGVLPSYAVPGDLLRKGKDVYRKISKTGAEFLNHGDREHTYFDEDIGEYRSCFFYDQEPIEAVNKDILAGDQTLREVLGIVPMGFRTPHFGTFQKSKHLRFLHQTLKDLGYLYSSSTCPLFSFRFGPAGRFDGIREFPVMGMATHPLTILDSWGFYKAPERELTPFDFLRESRQITSAMKERVGILNFYADPIHIFDQETFFKAIVAWRSIASPIHLSELHRRLP